MKFILVCFVALCLYELVVFLYFRFVKENSEKKTKSEMRKMREASIPHGEVRSRLSFSGKANSFRSEGKSLSLPNDWEDLIDYKQNVKSNVGNDVCNQRERVVDAFLPGDTHADFSKRDEEIRRSMDELLGGGSQNVDDWAQAPNRSSVVEPVGKEADVVSTEPKHELDASNDETKSILSEFDFSNMMK